MANVYKEVGPGSDASSLKGENINDSAKSTNDMLQYDGTEFVYITPQEVINLTSANDSISISENAVDARLLRANGVEDKSKFTISYDESTRVFTVNVASGAVYWASDKRYSPAASDNQTAAHADTTGEYWLYYAADTLTVGTSPSILNHNFLAYVHYNATTNKGVLFDERHPNDWPSYIHEYTHDTRGSALESGGTIADYVLDTFGNAALSFSIASCVFHDESYEHTLTALADNGPYTVWYRSGSDANNEWSWDLTPVIGVLDDGDDIYYNELNAGTWSNTATTNNYFVNYWLCGTNAYDDSGNNYKHRFINIMGQAIYSNESGALDETLATDIDFGDNMPSQEIVPLYRLTYKCQNNGGGKDIKLTTVTRIVGTTLNASIAANPTSHSGLSDRDAIGSHPASAISFNASPLSSSSTDLQSLGEDFAIDSLSGFLESPTAKTYTLELAAPYAYTITGLSTNTASGYITANVAIDGTNVTGITSINSNATHTRVDASAANTVSANSHVTLVLSGGSTPADLSFTLHTLR
jgi:hypothetical protein